MRSSPPKAYRYYFRDAISVKVVQIDILPMGLNIAFGKIKKREHSVSQVATPVAGSDQPPVTMARCSFVEPFIRINDEINAIEPALETSADSETNLREGCETTFVLRWIAAPNLAIFSR